MEIVLNSKLFSGLSVEQLGEKAAELGFDGIDLNIRPGHPVNPDNVTKTLPEAIFHWASHGLSCPLATAPTSMIDPQAPEVERIYSACAEAGVPRLKIGFYRFAEGEDYWEVLDAARASLEAFAKFSEKYGVQTCYQIHSGRCLGSNCAGLMHLIRDFPPEHVGAYPDIGHLALDGEYLPIGLAMIRDYLSIVGIKDPYYAPQPIGNSPAFQPKFTIAGQGCVDWPLCFETFKSIDFDGPLTVHTEYDLERSMLKRLGNTDSEPPDLEACAKSDAEYLKGLISKLD